MANDSSKSQKTICGHRDIGKLNILDVCVSCAEERCVQALDCEVATIEEEVAELLDRSPVVTCHIDLGSNLCLSVWSELSCDRCELDKCILAVNLEYVRSLYKVRDVGELVELTNNTCCDRLALAVELNLHLVGCGVQSCGEDAVVASRNCNVDWSCRLAEYQWLVEGYGYLARSALACSQSSVCAIYGELTCNLAIARLYNQFGDSLAATLNSKAEHTCEVVHLDCASSIGRVAVHWSCTCCESAYGVRLLGSKGYRIGRTLAYALSCRVNHAVRCVQRCGFEREGCSYCAIIVLCQRHRRYAVD